MGKKSSQKSVSEIQAAQPGKGQASRAAILFAAAKLVTTRGLEGLSIGDLADHLGMSKSGLYAHFKSKAELELATIETAGKIFGHEVLEPAMKAPAGSKRLLALVDAFLSHVERRVFPGGCFFAAVATELDTRPGAAHDRVLEVLKEWLGLLSQCLSDAQAAGEIDSRTEISQAVFEIEAAMFAGNFLFVMTGDVAPLRQARRGIEHILDRIRATPVKKKK